MKKSFAVLMLAMAAIVVSGAAFKVDVDGRANKIKIAIGELSTGRAVHAAWAKDLKESYLCFEGSVKNEWNTFKFSFIPQQSGTVTIAVRGSSRPRPKADWIFYDDFKVTGATIKNPSFENFKNGVLSDWTKGHYGVIRDAKDAPDGKTYVSSSHNNALHQNINVVAGQKVTIEFKARYDRLTPGQTHPQALKRPAR